MNWHNGIKLGSLLAIVSLAIFEFMLHRQSNVFREFETVLLSLQWMLLIYLPILCGTFLILTFSLNDVPLIGLLIVAIVAYFIGHAVVWPQKNAFMLLATVTLGKGARVLLSAGGRMQKNNSEFRIFLIGLVVLLAFSSWLHLDMSGNAYHGPRWMGLWDNPNDYGMLMGAGLVLAAGLIAAKERKEHKENPNSSFRPFLRSLRSFAAIDSIIFFIAAGMIGVGLFFSYSRGAWLGVAVGLLYLAKAHGTFKWRFVLPGIFVVAAVVCFFWNATPDSSPWYVKRLDLGRPSAQHRVAAWCGAFQMMRDHPLGVGWDKTTDVYQKNYSPPEDGAAAITTNDYLMLGTELGLPGLICFVGYVWLSLGRRSKVESRETVKALSPVTCHSPLQTSCRAGALALLVAFWFDGGLFMLATASVFWILLELGISDLAANRNR
jgi:hypothetical protein